MADTPAVHDARPSHLFPEDPLPPVILGASVNLLAGAPGTGKTAFIAWLVRQLATGGDIFGLRPKTPPYQAFIAADRSWIYSTIRWFQLEGMDHLPAYSLQDDAGFKKSRLRKKSDRIAIFEECLDRVSPTGDGKFPLGSLIYVDPLALFLGGNLIDYDACLVACSELREICLQKGISIIGTAHAAKQKADKKEQYVRLQDRILGSAALFGYTDTQLYLAAPAELGRKPEDPYVFLWAPHHAKTAMFDLVRDEHGRFSPADGGTSPQPQPAAALLASPEAIWLRTEALGGDAPVRLGKLLELAALQSISRSALYRYLGALEQAGQIESPRRGLWKRVVPS